MIHLIKPRVSRYDFENFERANDQIEDQNIKAHLLVDKGEREDLFWNRRANENRRIRRKTQLSVGGRVHTVEFIADESGERRGIGRGISRNIAAFSRAGAQNPPNRPCLSNNHIHTGHFPAEQ